MAALDPDNEEELPSYSLSQADFEWLWTGKNAYLRGGHLDLISYKSRESYGPEVAKAANKLYENAELTRLLKLGEMQQEINNVRTAVEAKKADLEAEMASLGVEYVESKKEMIKVMQAWETLPKKPAAMSWIDFLTAMLPDGASLTQPMRKAVVKQPKCRGPCSVLAAITVAVAKAGQMMDQIDARVLHLNKRAITTEKKERGVEKHAKKNFYTNATLEAKSTDKQYKRKRRRQLHRAGRHRDSKTKTHVEHPKQRIQETYEDKTSLVLILWKAF